MRKILISVFRRLIWSNLAWEQKQHLDALYQMRHGKAPEHPHSTEMETRSHE
ncbi:MULTISPECIES: hypothetical protein [Photorhabdus]|uniref:Transposase n=2 Tax=Photorhabdus TaxID=29487 RepID=A0AAW6BTA7_9GAMM|nr:MULTISPECIES: hypothetical protein [Photorhabdus]EYU13905.1 hypothetical protein BA1DRAFT_03590 [Photorhabdus aegyptia]MDB6375060.1 hypothetical protein [Photorhabdus bodei]